MTVECEIGMAADALLSALPPDPNAPFCTEATYKRKTYRALKRERKIKIAYRKVASDYLLKREWDEVVNLAGLTARQRHVVEQRILGATYEHIGKCSCRTKQCAQQVFVQALKKIARAFHVYPYTGLSDVYSLETRRGVPTS